MSLKRLVAERLSQLAIPKDGSFSDGLRFLLDKDKVRTTAREATEWAKSVVTAVRDAPGQNPWRNASDDEIAQEILRRVKEKRSDLEDDCTD